MPRRKRTHFIHKSRAHTFQLVNAPTDAAHPSHHVFMPVRATAANEQLTPAPPPAPREAQAFAYNRQQFELGEYGFPHDGYDYSQHFRPIGGAGGVFMHALTALPHPDAASARTSQLRLKTRAELLQPSEQRAHSEQTPLHTWLSREDQQNRMRAIELIKRDRKNNPDLDELIAYLDSDGELDSTASDTLDSVIHQPQRTAAADALSDTDSALLEDDFVAIANATPCDPQPAHGHQPDMWQNIREPFRTPRELDLQFEKFMHGFQLHSTDEEYEQMEQQLIQQADKQPHQQHALSDQPLHHCDLLHALQAPHCNHSAEAQREHHHGAARPHHSASQPSSARAHQFEQYAAAELESGMEHLLRSYLRATPEQTFEAFDGVHKARESIRTAELAERQQIQKLNELHIESDGHDSDLDSQFERMYNQQQKWDCETILSTYSNVHNQPSLIDAPSARRRSAARRAPIIRLDPRTQAPAQFGHAAPSASSASALDYGTRRSAPAAAARVKGESKQEKKARKAAAKQMSRERRALKSEMRSAFGAENTKQARHASAIGNAKVAVKL